MTAQFGICTQIHKYKWDWQAGKKNQYILLVLACSNIIFSTRGGRECVVMSQDTFQFNISRLLAIAHDNNLIHFTITGIASAPRFNCRVASQQDFLLPILQSTTQASCQKNWKLNENNSCNNCLHSLVDDSRAYRFGSQKWLAFFFFFQSMLFATVLLFSRVIKLIAWRCSISSTT